MARIRSIHPGIFTDEGFASLSMPARVLLFGVWTEADDHGVFEWKPVTLKMRVMPVDNVDISALLEECERADVIKRYSEGRSYGLVRNFCRFQRPKKPKYVHPLPSEFYTYAGLKEDGSQIVLHQSRTGTESEPQREDGGGEGEEESGPEQNLKTRVFFEEFWKAYPRRDSEEQKERSEQKFQSLVKTGVDPKVIIFGAMAYCAKVRKQNTYATRYVKVAWRWMDEQDFSGVVAVTPSDEPTEPANKDWRSAVKRWLLNESNWPRWAGNAPGSPSCQCPPEILAEEGVCPNTARRIDGSWYFATIDTPELAANLSFAAAHKLKVRLYDLTIDGVERHGAYFMKRFPPGYDEATGEFHGEANVA